jgi:hypothetical protein
MNPNHKRHITSSGGIIDIIDDVYPSHIRAQHLSYAVFSKYSMDAATAEHKLESRNKTYFQSRLSTDELKGFNFFNEYFEPLWNIIGKREPHSSWILASSPLSTFYFHVDRQVKGCKTILYYVNDNWNRDWGGETLFANAQGECEVAVEYKPGRVVIFDSDIEHKPSQISMSAVEFRLTFVAQLNCIN